MSPPSQSWPEVARPRFSVAQVDFAGASSKIWLRFPELHVEWGSVYMGPFGPLLLFRKASWIGGLSSSKLGICLPRGSILVSGARPSFHEAPRRPFGTVGHYSVGQKNGGFLRISREADANMGRWKAVSRERSGWPMGRCGSIPRPTSTAADARSAGTVGTSTPTLRVMISSSATGTMTCSNCTATSTRSPLGSPSPGRALGNAGLQVGRVQGNEFLAPL